MQLLSLNLGLLIMGWDFFYKGREGFHSGERFCCILVCANCYIVGYVVAKKKKATCVQGSFAMHMIKWTLKHLLLSFCYHITHYTTKPFPL